VYTYVERRTLNTERMRETAERGQSDFFPYLQKAAGLDSTRKVEMSAPGPLRHTISRVP